MCGICGLFRFNNQPVDKNLVIEMNNTLLHRGPDAEGIWFLGHAALGHRRLSIIDLSESANQPMVSSNGQYRIAFNGEIYNYLDIKIALQKKGVKFKTSSDTEVILEAFAEYGVNCFAMFNGMFAIAIYDLFQATMYLARDQFGIKPLYYQKSQQEIAFASEMKAIKAYFRKNQTLDRQSLMEYIWFGNPLGNRTFYDEIKEVKPGTYLSITNSSFSEKAFFDINSIKEKEITEKEAVSMVQKLLESSVKRHLTSDVPVGIFLSGGVDSSAITAFASRHYKGKLRSYCAGFDFDQGPNEFQAAKTVAERFSTDHHELQIQGTDIEKTIVSLVEAHDEPFGDAGDIPLYLLTKEIKGQVKVILQGDGGDEFFGGYSRYKTMAHSNWWSAFSFLIPVISAFGIQNGKILRLQRFLDAISQCEPYRRHALLLTMESEFSKPERVLHKNFRNECAEIDPFLRYKEIYSSLPFGIDLIQALFFADSQIILKDTFFEKIDKSVMANSVEARVPFLDKDLCEFMLSVPASLKVKGGTPKFLLKEALKGLLPIKTLFAKKTGFGVPYSFWLKTSLKNFFLEQVHTATAAKYLDVEEISDLYNKHCSDIGNFGFLLWKVLIFATWINHEKTN